MASTGVVKVILSFYRDDEGSAFERHRGRVPFDIEKHNSMEIALIYGLYMYVRPQRVWFFSRFGHR